MVSTHENVANASCERVAKRTNAKKAVKKAKIDAFDTIMSTTNKIVATSNQDGGAKKAMKIASIRDLVSTTVYEKNRECHDFEKYLKRLHTRLVRDLHQQVRENGNIKVMLHIDAHYEKLKPKTIRKDDDEEDEGETSTVRPPVTLQTKLTPILSEREVRATANKLIQTLRERHINSMREGSGMVMR